MARCDNWKEKLIGVNKSKELRLLFSSNPKPLSYMSATRIMLVEDEFITLDNLRHALEDMGYVISGDAMKAEAAISILEERQTDLAILDIHLKNSKSGIWLGEQIQQRYHIPFIYLTAYGDKNTIAAAAKTKPASYLAKPFLPADLHAAIELALHTYAGQEQVLDKTEEQAPALLINDSIFVKDQLVYQRIAIRDIIYIQSFRNYVEIQTEEGKYVVRSTLKEFSERLPADQFIQTHRSYVINLQLVSSIGGNYAQVAGHEVPLSRNERATVISRLSTFS